MGWHKVLLIMAIEMLKAYMSECRFHLKIQVFQYFTIPTFQFAYLGVARPFNQLWFWSDNVATDKIVLRFY